MKGEVSMPGKFVLRTCMEISGGWAVGANIIIHDDK